MLTHLFVNEYSRDGTFEREVFTDRSAAAADAAAFEHVYVRTLTVIATEFSDLRPEDEDIIAADMAENRAERRHEQACMQGVV